MGFYIKKIHTEMFKNQKAVLLIHNANGGNLVKMGMGYKLNAMLSSNYCL